MAETLDKILQKIQSKRHEEVLGALGKVVQAIGSIPKEDPELKKLIKENKEAIDRFVKKMGEPQPEIKVETNQQKVIDEIKKWRSEMATLISGLNKRQEAVEEMIIAIHNRPIPERLKAVRRFEGGPIEYINIDYSKPKAEA